MFRREWEQRPIILEEGNNVHPFWSEDYWYYDTKLKYLNEMDK